MCCLDLKHFYTAQSCLSGLLLQLPISFPAWAVDALSLLGALLLAAALCAAACFLAYLVAYVIYDVASSLSIPSIKVEATGGGWVGARGTGVASCVGGSGLPWYTSCPHHYDQPCPAFLCSRGQRHVGLGSQVRPEEACGQGRHRVL